MKEKREENFFIVIQHNGDDSDNVKT